MQVMAQIRQISKEKIIQIAKCRSRLERGCYMENEYVHMVG
jgi:hypothetical protein